MFTEKLRSLLKFGTFSRRYKDIFDLYYLSSKVDIIKLLKCLDKYIFTDAGMKENDMTDVIHRINTILNNRTYQNRIKTSRRNWINKDIKQLVAELLQFLDEVAETAVIV